MANEKVGFFVEKNEGRPSTSNELVKNFVHPYKENTNKKNCVCIKQDNIKPKIEIFIGVMKSVTQCGLLCDVHSRGGHFLKDIIGNL